MTRRWFLALLAALTLTACGSGDRRFYNTDLSAANLRPEGTLLAPEGKTRQLSDFRGKITLVLFGYTNCPDLCPGMLRKYASLVRNLRTRDAERIQVLFVTLDPARDTPEKVDTYAKWFNPNFIGLSGSEQQIADIARQFSVVYSKKESPGALGYTIDHSTSAYVLDSTGQLRLAFTEAALFEPILNDLDILLRQMP